MGGWGKEDKRERSHNLCPESDNTDWFLFSFTDL